MLKGKLKGKKVNIADFRHAVCCNKNVGVKHMTFCGVSLASPLVKTLDSVPINPCVRMSTCINTAGGYPEDSQPVDVLMR